jgi:hypothetical protein
MYSVFFVRDADVYVQKTLVFVGNLFSLQNAFCSKFFFQNYFCITCFIFLFKTPLFLCVKIIVHKFFFVWSVFVWDSFFCTKPVL